MNDFLRIPDKTPDLDEVVKLAKPVVVPHFWLCDSKRTHCQDVHHGTPLACHDTGTLSGG